MRIEVELHPDDSFVVHVAGVEIGGDFDVVEKAINAEVTAAMYQLLEQRNDWIIPTEFVVARAMMRMGLWRLRRLIDA
jgi:hypothetical protein